MDPLGLPLEEFDAIGAYRTTDRGQTLDLSGALDVPGTDSETPFEGTRALGELLRSDPRVPECVTRNVFRYLAGREEEVGDHRSICAARDAFRAGSNSLLGLITTIVTSDSFRFAKEPS